MSDLTLRVIDDPTPELIATLGEGLTRHALPTTGVPGFLPLAVAAYRGDTLIGGVQGTINWNWLHVALIWIAEEARRSGLGSTLLCRIERVARERGCTDAHLDTFSYQARPFYERHGYEVFATLEDYPPGHRRIFLRKNLERSTGS